MVFVTVNFIYLSNDRLFFSSKLDCHDKMLLEVIFVK